MTDDALRYQIGFGNDFASEALPGALPIGQSNPQKPPFGLYTEEINGTPFTAPRGASRRSWTYRIRPSAVHEPFRQIASGLIRSAPFDEAPASPNQTALAAAADPESADRFRRGPRHDGRQRRSRRNSSAPRCTCTPPTRR